MEKIIISFDGNIGVGKTSLVESLKHYIDKFYEADHKVYSYHEELDKYWLEKLYGNPFKYANVSQTIMILNKFNQYKEILECKDEHSIHLIDRSLAGIDIFNRVMYEKGYLNRNQLVFLENLKNCCNELEDTKKIHKIYLAEYAESCLRNVKKRGNKYEQHIDLEYLNDINEAHIQCFVKQRDNTKFPIHYSYRNITTDDMFNFLLKNNILNKTRRFKIGSIFNKRFYTRRR